MADPLNAIHRFAALVFNFNFRANVGDAFQTVQRRSGGGDIVSLRGNCERTSATVLPVDENRNTQSDSLFAAAPHTTSKMRLAYANRLSLRGMFSVALG